MPAATSCACRGVAFTERVRLDFPVEAHQDLGLMLGKFMRQSHLMYTHCHCHSGAVEHRSGSCARTFRCFDMTFLSVLVLVMSWPFRGQSLLDGAVADTCTRGGVRSCGGPLANQQVVRDRRFAGHLFHEERNVCCGALIPDRACPVAGFIMRRSRTAFATDDHPADAAEIQVERTEQRLAGQEPHTRRYRTQQINPVGEVLPLDRNAKPAAGGYRLTCTHQKRLDSLWALGQHLIGINSVPASSSSKTSVIQASAGVLRGTRRTLS